MGARPAAGNEEPPQVRPGVSASELGATWYHLGERPSCAGLRVGDHQLIGQAGRLVRIVRRKWATRRGIKYLIHLGAQ